MGTSKWRWQSDEVVAATCRDAFGYPRIEQPSERRIGALAVACCLGAVTAAWTLAWVLTQ